MFEFEVGNIDLCVHVGKSQSDDNPSVICAILA